MQITDVIADMLTRIRNANSSKHPTVDIPASSVKKAIAQILLEEGYILIRKHTLCLASACKNIKRVVDGSCGAVCVDVSGSVGSL